MEEQNKKDLPAQSGGYFYYYLLIVVIILAGGWFLWKNGGWTPAEEAGEQGTTQDETLSEGTNILQGTLQASDNPARGNLMLVLGDQSPRYISTVRDFSSLVGKEVEVRIENMAEGFKLLDIAAKQQ